MPGLVPVENPPDFFRRWFVSQFFGKKRKKTQSTAGES